jgi:hypothetical protein
VEFLYRLGSGDDSAALPLVTDISLIAKARDFGLVHNPGDSEWYWYCTDSKGRPVGPFVGFPCILQPSDGSGYRFTFVESSGDWLISAIDACMPSYDPATGAHCD